jgi:hypothetical protein
MIEHLLRIFILFPLILALITILLCVLVGVHPLKCPLPLGDLQAAELFLGFLIGHFLDPEDPEADVAALKLPPHKVIELMI